MEERVTISHSSCTHQTDGDTTLSIPPAIQDRGRRSLKFVSVLNKVLALLMFLFSNGYGGAVVKATATQPPGVSEGVSMKSFQGTRSQVDFAWNSTMLSWQRTSFHFQPPRNWMNGTLYNSIL